MSTRYLLDALTLGGRGVLVAFLTAVSLCAHGAPAQHGAIRGPAPGPAGIEIPEAGISVPMQDFGGRPVVDVKINGKGPYRFILDTGAHISVIDTALNAELALPEAAGVRAAAAHGGPAPTVVSIQDLRMGESALHGLIGVVMPLDNLLRQLPGAENVPRGVLGASNFPGYLLTFDYPAKRISLAKGALEAADSKSTFEYGSDDPLPTVPVLVAGQSARVHVDTGSGSGLSLPTGMMKTIPLASEPKEGGRAKLMGGESTILKAQVRGPVELGGYVLVLPDISFSDLEHGGPAGVGNMGYEALRSFVVTLDSKHRRIRFIR